MVNITFKFVNIYGVKFVTWLIINDDDNPFEWNNYNIVCPPHASNSGMFNFDGDYNQLQQSLLNNNNDNLIINVQRFDK